MVPPPAATANAPVRRHASGSGARLGASARRVSLRLVGPRRRLRARGRAEGQARRNPNRLLNVVAVSLVLGSLLAVVVGQALLANGQVRLASLQHQLTLEQSSHRQAELAVSELETPSRIVAAASGQLHMVRPAQVTELPYVSLTTPLPTPKVTPAPAPPPPAAVTSSSTSASTSSGGSSSGSSATTPSTGSSGTAQTTTPSTGSSGTAQTTTTSTP